MHNLLISVFLVPVPIQRPNSSSFEFWMAIPEGLYLVLAWELGWSVRYGPLASGTTGYRRYILYSYGLSKVRHW
jgi:hypothetical protein